MSVVFQLKNGRQCVLRHPTEADAEQICEFFPRVDAESDFMARFAGEFDMTIEQEREFIREHSNSPNSTLVVVELGDRIIACAGLDGQKLKRFAHTSELGMTVLKEFWGLGIGRRLMEYLLDWAKKRNLRKVYLRVYDHNLRAIALYKDCGFAEEGRLKGDVLRADGTYGDTLFMAKFLS